MLMLLLLPYLLENAENSLFLLTFALIYPPFLKSLLNQGWCEDREEN